MNEYTKKFLRALGSFRFFSSDIGIDLGTASVLVYVKGKGIVLNEPSVVAVDKSNGRILSVGTDAQKMLGRTPGNIIAIRPLREGVISDYEMTERMIKEFIRKVLGFRLFKPNVVMCVPSVITEVEERAAIDAGTQAGAKRVFLVEEPVAAAIGAGIDIAKPNGNMIVDIGGGTTDIAVISLGGIVESTSIKIAGDKFDESIIKYIRRKHNVLIGERTAEDIKKEIGCVYPRPEETSTIVEAIHAVLERTPPELTGDISTNGIVMTGGGAMVWGFDKLIAAKTGIPTRVSSEAISCVALGTGSCLENLQTMQDGTMNLSRRRQMMT